MLGSANSDQLLAIWLMPQKKGESSLSVGAFSAFELMTLIDWWRENRQKCRKKVKPGKTSTAGHNLPVWLYSFAFDSLRNSGDSSSDKGELVKNKFRAHEEFSRMSNALRLWKDNKWLRCGGKSSVLCSISFVKSLWEAEGGKWSTKGSSAGAMSDLHLNNCTIVW